MAYADVDGNIGYVMTGEVVGQSTSIVSRVWKRFEFCPQVPTREGQRGAEQNPLAGWSGQHDWTNFVEHSKLPKSFNPPSGVIISANHKVTTQD
eukprot:1897824-Amphidinium_carterae.1